MKLTLLADYMTTQTEKYKNYTQKPLKLTNDS